MRTLFYLIAAFTTLIISGCQTLPTPRGQFSTTSKVIDSSDHHRAKQLDWSHDSHPESSAVAWMTVGEISSTVVTEAEGIVLAKLCRNPHLDWARVSLASRTTNEAWHISALREEPAQESLAESFEIFSIVHTRAFANGYAKEDRRISAQVHPDGTVRPMR